MKEKKQTQRELNPLKMIDKKSTELSKDEQAIKTLSLCTTT
jgi:hypothetical protein